MFGINKRYPAAKAKNILKNKQRQALEKALLEKIEKEKHDKKT